MGSPPNRLPITPECRNYLVTEVLPRVPIDYSRGQILGMAKAVVTDLFKAKKAGHAFIIRRGPPHNYKAFFDIVRAWASCKASGLSWPIPCTADAAKPSTLGTRTVRAFTRIRSFF